MVLVDLLDIWVISGGWYIFQHHGAYGIWWFPKVGVPQSSSICRWMFHSKPSSDLGVPPWPWNPPTMAYHRRFAWLPPGGWSASRKYGGESFDLNREIVIYGDLNLITSVANLFWRFQILKIVNVFCLKTYWRRCLTCLKPVWSLETIFATWNILPTSLRCHWNDRWLLGAKPCPMDLTSGRWNCLILSYFIQIPDWQRYVLDIYKANWICSMKKKWKAPII